MELYILLSTAILLKRDRTFTIIADSTSNAKGSKKEELGTD